MPMQPCESREQALGKVLSQACPLPAVATFLRAVLQQLIPTELLGAGKAVFLRHATDFLAQRKFEGLTVHSLLQHMPTRGICWLHALCAFSDPLSPSKLCVSVCQTTLHSCRPGTCAAMHTARQEQLGLLLYWLAAAVVVPLLRGCFYVTDAQPTGAALHFFRKPVWRRLETTALASLTNSIYQVMTSPHWLASAATSACNHATSTPMLTSPMFQPLEMLVVVLCVNRVSRLAGSTAQGCYGHAQSPGARSGSHALATQA